MADPLARRIAGEAAKFVAAGAQYDLPMAPSRVVDEGWHALHTALYRDLCHRHGRYVDHHPGYIPDNYDPAVLDHTKRAILAAGSRSTLACGRLPPTAASRSPQTASTVADRTD